MEKYYFIIRVREWCSGFYYGTMKDLEFALEKVGAEIIGSEDYEFERIGLIFDTRITTKMKVYGRDAETFNRIMDGIVEVFQKNGMDVPRRQLDDIYDLRYRATRDVIFDTDKLDVLVSDGVFHPKPDHGYIGVYASYKPFSEFSEEWIWTTFGSLCGCSNPKLVY